jgi:hypothetical protein
MISVQGFAFRFAASVIETNEGSGRRTDGPIPTGDSLMNTLLRIGLATALLGLEIGIGSTPCLAGLTILNPGFETPNLGTSPLSYEYSPTEPGVAWTFTGASGIAANGSNWGVGGPGFGLSSSGAFAPEGTQVAFLQGEVAEIDQTLSGFQPGFAYSFSFMAAQRPTLLQPIDGINTYSQQIEVFLDSSLICTVTPSLSSLYETYFTGSITPNDFLPHTLRFVGTDAAWIAAGSPANEGDNTAFIDYVTSTAVPVAIPEPSSFVMSLTAATIGLIHVMSRRDLNGNSLTSV